MHDQIEHALLLVKRYAESRKMDRRLQSLVPEVDSALEVRALEKRYRSGDMPP